MITIAALLVATNCVCGLDHVVTHERCEVLWTNAVLSAEEASRPLSLAGFCNRALYTAGALDFRAEVAETDGGEWKKAGLKRRSPGVYDLKFLSGTRFRLVANRAATNVTAVVNLSNPSGRKDAEWTGLGPWDDTAVKAGEFSDPCSIHGYDDKYLTISTDNGASVLIELDITGTGTWIPFRTFTPVTHFNISRVRAFRLRAVADRDCRATVHLECR